MKLRTADLKKIADELSKLTVLEAVELSKMLKRQVEWCKMWAWSDFAF
jgi:ribosomal protein L7/L12